mmetsp:Transcript_26087/g.37094  ORF Transcript_26087/g.37094 Transcript_26087/m.37094 type:complete len:89 (+) Transcript_26087:274-540(+)
MDSKLPVHDVMAFLKLVGDEGEEAEEEMVEKDMEEEAIANKIVKICVTKEVGNKESETTRIKKQSLYATVIESTIIQVIISPTTKWTK